MNVFVSQTENLVKAKLIRALVGGFVGTVVFTLMGQFVAPNVIGQPMDVAALLAPALGGSHTAGVIAHFVTGTVVFSIAYLIFGLRYLPGPAWLRGAIFLIPLYLRSDGRVWPCWRCCKWSLPVVVVAAPERRHQHEFSVRMLWQ